MSPVSRQPKKSRSEADPASTAAPGAEGQGRADAAANKAQGRADASADKAQGRADASANKAQGRADTAADKAQGRAGASANKAQGRADASADKAQGRADASADKAQGRADASVDKAQGRADTAAAKAPGKNAAQASGKEPSIKSTHLEGATTRGGGGCGEVDDVVAAGSCEGTMCALMSTAKMIHRFIESKINKHKHLNKLSGPRIGVLFVVHESGGTIRMGDLAAKLSVNPRTATDLVDGLERDGFIQRRPDPTDRRALLLELTPGARVDFEKISALRMMFVQEIFGHMTDAERNILSELLTKVKQGPLSKMLENQLKQESGNSGE